MRQYQSFSYRNSNFRLCSTRLDLITAEIVRQRELLEQYILLQPLFRTSLEPIGLLPGAPPIAERMAAAAAQTGVGPLAAVAGAIAQAAAEAALAGGATEAIVENGGDLYLASPQPLRVGIYAGPGSAFNCLAFEFTPEQLPLSLCSSSSLMGHSLSFGRCQLASVLAKDAPLADAAATLAGNLVRCAADIDPTLTRLLRIPGIQGAVIICEEKIGLGGNLPKLCRQDSRAGIDLVTRDKFSNFPHRNSPESVMPQHS